VWVDDLHRVGREQVDANQPDARGDERGRAARLDSNAAAIAEAGRDDGVGATGEIYADQPGLALLADEGRGPTGLDRDADRGVEAARDERDAAARERDPKHAPRGGAALVAGAALGDQRGRARRLDGDRVGLVEPA